MVLSIASFYCSAKKAQKTQKRVLLQELGPVDLRISSALLA